MKCFFVLITCFSSIFSIFEGGDFSPGRFTSFYDDFLCEEKTDLHSSGLTGLCSDYPTPTPSPTPTPTPPSCASTFTPPANPSPPRFKSGFLPIVLVNNSGLPDDEVYVLITGDDLPDVNQVWGNINTTPGVAFGEITYQDVAAGDNAETFSYLLSELPLTTSGRVIYTPQVRSGLIWFSMNKKLNMPVNTNGSPPPPYEIVQPSFTDPADPNYATNYDIFEFTFLLAGSPQVNADATAVSFFSIPLYGYVAGATTLSANTGLYQPRSCIMQHAAEVLATAVETTQWNKLLLTQGSEVLRLLSPGKSIAASSFDANYLDNSSSYGYSYIEDIWTGTSSYYRTGQHDMSLIVTVTSPSTATYNYTGNVQGDNTFLFTSTNGGPDVTFPAPVTSPTPTGTTSYNIFSALNFISPLPTAGTAADAISKLMQESIIAGLVPTTDTLSLDYLSTHHESYYTVNPNLLADGKITGPWYDLYSKALTDLGSIYTYGFSEPLAPRVLIGGPFVADSTYIGITIGRID